jgi:hypothetical protein
MNKPKLKLIALAVVLQALPTVVRAQYFTCGDFACAVNNGSVWIRGYTGPIGEVTIPNMISNMPVVGISGTAFYGNGNIAGVMIPNSVTNIGVGAFGFCTSLARITVPDSVTSMGDKIFAECYSLMNVTIGSGISSIGYGVFESCQSLTSVMIPKNVTSIGLQAFYQCYSLTNVTIGSGVTSIGENAFSSCTNLTSVTMGNNVASIGESAFYECSSLISITIPKSVTTIGITAFGFCSSLTSVYFQGDVPACRAYPFNDDYNATIYYLPGTSGWSSPLPWWWDWSSNYWPYNPPAFLWNPQAQTGDASFGVRTNQFGFNITGPNDLNIVVEACTDISNPVWQPVQTITLTGGSSYFSDPQWTNYPNRFYRLRSP